MAKLTDFQTPTGVKGNLLNPTSLWQLVLGSAVMLGTFAIGQGLLGRVGSKAPFLDTQIEKPYNDPVTPTKSNSVEVL